jgi:hypothetical protein
MKSDFHICAIWWGLQRWPKHTDFTLPSFMIQSKRDLGIPGEIRWLDFPLYICNDVDKLLRKVPCPQWVTARVLLVWSEDSLWPSIQLNRHRKAIVGCDNRFSYWLGALLIYSGVLGSSKWPKWLEIWTFYNCSNYDLPLPASIFFSCM